MQRVSSRSVFTAKLTAYLHLSHSLHSRDNMTEHDVFAVKPASKTQYLPTRNLDAA